jgi:hypothetical protein
MLATLLVSTGLYVGLGIGALVVVLVIVVLMRGKHEPADSSQKPEPVADDPSPGMDADVMSPTTSHPQVPDAPVADEPEHRKPVKKEEPEPAEEKPVEKAEEEPASEAEQKPADAAKPPTLEVEALSPSATGEAPSLSAETSEMKMATDEMPKFGTAEVPQLADAAPAKYRTPAAQELSAAIASGECPKCKAPVFVGSEDPEEVGTDGVAMFKITGRCGACGHRAELIDMKVGQA